MTLRKACFAVWILLLGTIPLSLPATAQQAATADGQTTISLPPEGAAAVGELLNRGRELENQRRWGEALTLYEEALRQFPTARDLEQRLRLSRFHYDLARRYSDNSFRRAVTTISARQALDLYAEVLLKVQSHYVEAPDWQRLVDSGTTGLQVALTDPLFIEANLPQLSPARIDHFRRHLRNWLGGRPVGSRHAAREVATLAARLAREQLGLRDAICIFEYLCGAANSLDPYSTYLTSGQLEEVYSQIEGNFVGLGVELKTVDGSLQIVKVIPGSPAERSGIRAGDRIMAVDGRSTANFSTDQAANLLQGKEGSQVEIAAVAPDGELRKLQVRREHVEIPSIDGERIVDATSGIAYLKLTCFQKTTARDLDAALWRLHKQGMKSLVIDLRGNPGGLLTTSVDVVDRFVDRGVIVSTRGRSPQEDYSYSAHEAGTWRMPLVVLIDGDSASASEIFAGAIRDHGRGTIVGARSYGKGSVQGIFPLGLANSGLRLTTAKFYSPSGRAITQVGVEPHVVVREAAKPLLPDEVAQSVEGTTDIALDAAVDAARSQMARR